MKLIYRVHFVALLLAQLPFLAAQKSANPDSRAEELRERRRQKGREIVPPKTSGIEKAFLKMESGEIIRQIKAIRWKDFYPKFGQISPNSGMGGGVRYYKRTGLGLAVEGSAAISFTSYRQAEPSLAVPQNPAAYLMVRINTSSQEQPQWRKKVEVFILNDSQNPTVVGIQREP